MVFKEPEKHTCEENHDVLICDSFSVRLIAFRPTSNNRDVVGTHLINWLRERNSVITVFASKFPEGAASASDVVNPEKLNAF